MKFKFKVGDRLRYHRYGPAICVVVAVDPHRHERAYTLKWDNAPFPTEHTLRAVENGLVLALNGIEKVLNDLD